MLWMIAVASGCDDSTGPDRVVVLSPERAALGDTVATTTCAQGERFLTVDLTVTNKLEGAIPLGISPFFVVSTAAAEFPADPVTASHAQGCEQGASLAPEGQKRCTVVFRTPADADLSTIVYKVPGGGTFSAPLQVTPCQVCGQRCTDTSFDNSNCGGCGKPVGLGVCVEGLPVCTQGATNCSGKCVDLQTDPANCGGCSKPVGQSAICVAGSIQQCSSADAPSGCDGKCVNLLYENGNCGECGRACAAPSLCNKGLCCSNVESKEMVSCDTVCGATACETNGATYSGPCNGTTKIVLGTVATCHDAPTPTETADGCTLPFNHIDCNCCE
jgi:hypothetical protein